MSDVGGTGRCPPRKFPELQVSTEEVVDASGRSTLAQTGSWLQWLTVAVTCSPEGTAHGSHIHRKAHSQLVGQPTILAAKPLENKAEKCPKGLKSK